MIVKLQKSNLTIRITQERKDKLYLWAYKKGKTVTGLIEEYIDSLPDIPNGS